jgi:hypothetical protein
MTDPPHLTNAAAGFLLESNANRMRAILGERWVHYPRAGHVLQILHRLLDHPRTTRMPSIAIYGDSGMGKTMIRSSAETIHRYSTVRQGSSGPGCWLCRWQANLASVASTRRS